MTPSGQQSSQRDEILAALRLGTRDAAIPPASIQAAPVHPSPGETSLLSRDDLGDLFLSRVAEFGARVTTTERSKVPDAIFHALALHSVENCAAPHDLPSEWMADRYSWLIDDGSVPATELAVVDGVVTGCAIAIAATGTIVLDSGPSQGRRAISLLPDLHVCVVFADQLVDDVPAAITRCAETVRVSQSPLTLISGPSATSDIELHRIEGVHGPRRLDVILAL